MVSGLCSSDSVSMVVPSGLSVVSEGLSMMDSSVSLPSSCDGLSPIPPELVVGVSSSPMVVETGDCSLKGYQPLDYCQESSSLA